MSDTPIFDENNSARETPIYSHIEKPELFLGPITGPVHAEASEHGVIPPKKWWQKILTPTFRRWAYGVTAAALTAGAIWAGKPEFIPVALPLVMAIYYVDKNGEPHA